MSPARTRVALAAAAVVLFGASFAIGKAGSGGDDEKVASSPDPKAAPQVELPGAESDVSTLANVGQVPALKPKPEPVDTSSTDTSSTDTSSTDTSSTDTSSTDTSSTDTSSTDTSSTDTSSTDTSSTDTSSTDTSAGSTVD